MIDILSFSREPASGERPHQWLGNFGSGDGLVPLGNKPLPEPILTKIVVPLGHSMWYKWN